MDAFIIGAIVGLFVLALWAAFTFVGALFFAWAWNLVMPLLWAAAPHITWLHAFAISILIGTLKGIVQFSKTVNKRK